jgi:hypothetical protein
MCELEAKGGIGVTTKIIEFGNRQRVRSPGNHWSCAGTQDTLQDSSATLLSAIALTFLSSVFSRPKNFAISVI